jgi:hypothetical protein
MKDHLSPREQRNPETAPGSKGRTLSRRLSPGTLMHMASKAKAIETLNGWERSFVFQMGQLGIWRRKLSEQQENTLEGILVKAFEGGIAEAPCQYVSCRNCEEMIMVAREFASQEQSELAREEPEPDISEEAPAEEDSAESDWEEGEGQIESPSVDEEDIDSNQSAKQDMLEARVRVLTSFRNNLEKRATKAQNSAGRKITYWIEENDLELRARKLKRRIIVTPVFVHEGVPYPLFYMYSNGRIDIRFHEMDHPFDNYSSRVELRNRLNEVAGFMIHPEHVRRKFTGRLEMLADRRDLDLFLKAFEWYMMEIVRRS